MPAVQPELSLLIPTMSTRRSLLSRLLWTLEPQLDPAVEVLISTSDTISMGDQFNRLFAQAKGRLGVIVDDDDLVVANYVRTVLSHTKDADYVGYKVLYTISGRYREVYASDPRSAVHEPYRLDQTLRHIMHKCPVDVERARKHLFGQHYNADYYWVTEMIEDGYPFSPVVLDDVLYHYDYWPQFSAGTTLILPGQPVPIRSVGLWPYYPERFTWIGDE
jgi:hypothetical protein